MDDPAPVRITFAQGSAAAVNRTFIGWFFVFAILFAGAAFYRPAIQAFAVGFPIYLVLLKLRLRTATRPGWALSSPRTSSRWRAAERIAESKGPRSLESGSRHAGPRSSWLG